MSAKWIRILLVAQSWLVAVDQPEFSIGQHDGFEQPSPPEIFKVGGRVRARNVFGVHALHSVVDGLK